MSSVADRIQEKMSEFGLKHKDLVSATGASKGAVSHWLSGVNTPSGERLLSLARLLKTSPDWILTGKENKQGLSNKMENESNVSFISTPLREIPLLDYVQAGLFHDVGYDGINPIGSSWTTYMGAKPECIFSLKVEGLSMSPTFMPGDELVVDGSLEAKPGSLVIAQEVQHGIARTTFKKYRVIGVNEFGVDIIELVPLNPDFPTLNSLQIDISIIGVVVRHNREV